MGGAIPLADDSREAQPDFEYRMVAADGRVVWVRDLITVPESGATTRLHGVMVDITGRKQAEDALREQRISSILRTIRFSSAI